MSEPLYLTIALPVPLRRLFDYLPPEGMSRERVQNLLPGIRVQVPFGKKSCVGLLLGVSAYTNVTADKLKPVARILDHEPLLPQHMLALVLWAADYYQYPAGDALLFILPTLLREGEPASVSTHKGWRLTTFGKGLPTGALKRSPKQAALLERLQQGEMRHSEGKILNISSATFRDLDKKGLIESFEKKISLAFDDGPAPATSMLAEKKIILNAEQQQALSALNSTTRFTSFLLQGITGSGKTEVYLQAIEHVLKQGKQALVLVPEIGLTPQTIDRFRKRFNKPVVAFHSGLNNRERLDAWLQASQHKASIVIGTRSAIFTPMPSLGMIIIDEEHDSSFKQQDGFRYHARDTAIMRAQRENIPVILGSATPSLETLFNAQNKRYQWLRLTQRAGAAKLPQVTLLDVNNKKLHEGFAEELLDAIRHELKQENQVLVFLNRRGYAPVLICGDCGWIANCNHCTARLTVHKHDHLLRCHHCGWQNPIPGKCPSCQSTRLDYLGLGTQRSEEILAQFFPDTNIIRIDRDSIQRKNALGDILDTIQKGEPAILVGTQMIAKGHHFPHVTLVAILDADGGIFSADFRSAERLGQLVTQVAGRAGRAEKAGRVLIQSRFADHPTMQLLATQNYDVLAQQLLTERNHLNLPPCRSQAIFRTETPNPDNGLAFLEKVRRLAESLLVKSIQGPTCPVQLIGPVPSLMEKRAGLFRHELIFFTSHRPALQQLLHELALQIETSPEGKKYRWAIDVDPI